MTIPAQTLEVIQVPIDTITQPSHPLILADSAFIASLKAVSATVEQLKVSGVTDATSSQLASELQQKLTTGGKKLDAARLALKRPYIDMSAKIDEVARGPMTRIEALKKTLSDLNTAYIVAEQRKARAAEEARQKELRDLELKRQQEERDRLAKEAEAKRKADEAIEAAKTTGTILVLDDDDLPEVEAPKPTVTEERIAQIQAAPAVVAQKPSGVRITHTLVFTVTDINLLADVFVDKSPKNAAIRAAYCAGWSPDKPIPTVAGLKFEAQTTTQSTGRSGF